MSKFARVRHRFRLGATVVALVGSLAACSNALPSTSTNVSVTFPRVAAAADKVPATIREAGVLQVAIPTNEPPTQFYRDGTQEMTGVNPEIAGLVAGALGLRLEIKVASFDAIIPGIDAARYDMTVASMTPTTMRMTKLDFVDYLQFGSAIAVAKDNPQHIGFDSLCGKNVAALIGSYQLTNSLPPLEEACLAAGSPAIVVHQFQDTRQAVSSLLSGRTDVVYADSPILSYAALQNPGLAIADINDITPVAVGTLKGSGLDLAVAEAMKSIIASPEYLAVLDRYGLGKAAAITDPRVNFAQ